MLTVVCIGHEYAEEMICYVNTTNRSSLRMVSDKLVLSLARLPWNAWIVSEWWGGHAPMGSYLPIIMSLQIHVEVKLGCDNMMIVGVCVILYTNNWPDQVVRLIPGVIFSYK